jgi:hypothetical protein
VDSSPVFGRADDSASFGWKRRVRVAVGCRLGATFDASRSIVGVTDGASVLAANCRTCTGILSPVCATGISAVSEQLANVGTYCLANDITAEPIAHSGAVKCRGLQHAAAFISSGSYVAPIAEPIYAAERNADDNAFRSAVTRSHSGAYECGRSQHTAAIVSAVRRRSELGDADVDTVGNPDAIADRASDLGANPTGHLCTSLDTDGVPDRRADSVGGRGRPSWLGRSKRQRRRNVVAGGHLPGPPTLLGPWRLYERSLLVFPRMVRLRCKSCISATALQLAHAHTHTYTHTPTYART